MPATKVATKSASKAPKTVQKKASTKASSKKAPVQAAPAPTPAPAVEVAPATPVAETTTTNEVVVQPFSEVMQAMNTFQSNLQATINALSQLKSEYKALEKKIQREARVTAKALSKRRRKAGTRAPSGFVKPTRISDELAGFLGKEKGTEMARTAVTKEINSYIKAHDLKDAKNGRIIHPDAKLSKLLNVTKEDEVTYFNLQKYMSHHFQKSTPAAQASA